MFTLLSSKVFLLWMIGGWIIYYVISAIWIKEAFGVFAAGLGNNLLIQIPFVLFLITGCLNLLRASRDMFRDGKVSFIIWFILPAGILVFLTGFFLSLCLRQSGQRVTGEGDIVKPPWVEVPYRVTKIEPGLRDAMLDTDMDKSIFSHEPRIKLVDDSSNVFEVGAFPPGKIGDTYYHILNFGIAPGIRLFEGTNIVYRGYPPLKLLAVGKSDFFEIPPYPYRFLISLEPEKTVQRGNTSTSEYNIKAPTYRVRVFRGEKMIAEGNSRKWIRFDSYTLQFFRHSYWALLEAAKDPGLPVLRLGLLLVAIGIPLSLLRGMYKAVTQ